MISLRACACTAPQVAGRGPPHRARAVGRAISTTPTLGAKHLATALPSLYNPTLSSLFPPGMLCRPSARTLSAARPFAPSHLANPPVAPASALPRRTQHGGQTGEQPHPRHSGTGWRVLTVHLGLTVHTVALLEEHTVLPVLRLARCCVPDQKLTHRLCSPRPWCSLAAH